MRKAESSHQAGDWRASRAPTDWAGGTEEASTRYFFLTLFRRPINIYFVLLVGLGQYKINRMKNLGHTHQNVTQKEGTSQMSSSF